MRRQAMGMVFLFCIVLLSSCAMPRQFGPPSEGLRAAGVFDQASHSPVELRMFLERFPKGGDLHNHLSGAIYAEDFMDWAEADGVCFDVKTLAATSPPCDAGKGRPVLKTALEKGLVSGDAVIDAWSMRNFVPGYSAASGHDQFFATFSRFGAAGDSRHGDMLAAVVRNAADQHIDYLELMTSPGMGAARELARKVGPQPNMDVLYTALMAAGIKKLVPKAAAEFDRMVAEKNRQLGCQQSGTAACRVQVRFLAQVVRTFPPEQVFAQSMLAFLLVKSDPDVVGLNLVAPEDNPVTLKTYETQMQQLGYLATRLGPVPISLHAGELTLGLVPPRDLRNHIREAVELAGARRIGHGVDIGYEVNAEQLLREMARKNIAVEINLTSNAQILGVEGDQHPFQTYRAHGVPLTLSTDDAGVSRGTLTNEYERAVLSYHLKYSDIVTLSRNAASYSFLPGAGLWASPHGFLPVAACRGQRLGNPSPDRSCAAFLAASEKARLQWRLEAQLAAFDADPLGLGH